MNLISKAVDAAASATIVQRTVNAREAISLRYAGPTATFVVDDLQIARISCFATQGAVAAETLDLQWSQPFPAGTEIRFRVRNVTSAPATFVVTVGD